MTRNSKGFCGSVERMDMEMDNIDRRVRELHVPIASMIRGPHVLHHLHSVLSHADCSTIERTYLKSPDKATFCMVDKLLKSTEPGKWQIFIRALEDEGYPYLTSLLRCENRTLEDQRHQKKILQVFAPYLEKQLNPREIVLGLLAEDVIDIIDMDAIIASERTSGSISATAILLDRIQTRLAPSVWYTRFLQVLYRKGHRDIVLEMEPEFSICGGQLKCPKIIISDEDNCAGENPGFEQRVESRLQKYRQDVVELIQPEHIIPYISELITEGNVHKNEGWEMGEILNMLQATNTMNKWKCFVSALRLADYNYVADLLTSDTNINHSYRERNLLKIFKPTLEKQLEPQELLSRFLADGIINVTDKELVTRVYQHKGSFVASCVLIDQMQRRVSPEKWYRSLLHNLVQIGRKDLAEVIDPDIVKRQSCISNSIQTNTMETAFMKRMKEKIKDVYLEKSKADDCVNLNLAEVDRHFHRMKNSLLEKIDERNDSFEKIMDDIRDKLSRYEEDISPDDEHLLLTEVDNNLRQARDIMFSFEPCQHFMNCKSLGVLQVPVRENVCGIQPHGIISNQLKTLTFLNGERERSISDSRSDSSSSGFIRVDGRTSSSDSESWTETTNVKQTISGFQNLQSKEMGINVTMEASSLFQAEDCDKNSYSSSSSSQSSYIKQPKSKRFLNEGDRGCFTEKPQSKYLRTKSYVEQISEQKSWVSRIPGRKRHDSDSVLFLKSEISKDIVFKTSGTSFSHNLDSNSLLRVKIEPRITSSKSFSIHKAYTFQRRRTKSESSGTSTDVFPASLAVSTCDDSQSLTSVSSVSSEEFELSEIVSYKETRSVDSKMVINEESLEYQTIADETKDQRIPKFYKKCTLPYTFTTGRFVIADLCVLDNETLLLIDQANAVIIMYEVSSNRLNISALSKEVPFKICSCSENAVIILCRSRKCSSKLLSIYVERHKLLKRKVSWNFGCVENLACISSFSGLLLACCFDKHIHILSSNGVEKMQIQLKWNYTDWWPLCMSVNRARDLLLYEIYSKHLVSFNFDNGHVKWMKHIPHIEGMCCLDDIVYLSQTKNNKLIILSAQSGDELNVIFENNQVQYPFALAASHVHRKIFMSQYNINGNVINRTVRCFKS